MLRVKSFKSAHQKRRCDASVVLFLSGITSTPIFVQSSLRIPSSKSLLDEFDSSRRLTSVSYTRRETLKRHLEAAISGISATEEMPGLKGMTKSSSQQMSQLR